MSFEDWCGAGGVCVARGACRCRRRPRLEVPDDVGEERDSLPAQCPVHVLVRPRKLGRLPRDLSDVGTPRALLREHRRNDEDCRVLLQWRQLHGHQTERNSRMFHRFSHYRLSKAQIPLGSSRLDTLVSTRSTRLARLARHVACVKPMHFGCVELVEQHGSIRSRLDWLDTLVSTRA